MFIIIFNHGFSTKVNYQILAHLNLEKKDNIFHIIDQIKVAMVALWIEHCHPCMVSYLNLRLQSLLVKEQY